MSSPTTTPPPMPPVIPPPRRPRCMFGPVVLIAIGVVFTLRNFGYLKSAALLHWFALYWPVLIIVWGLFKLLDHYQAQRAGYHARGLGGGGVVLLIFLILCGLAISGSEKVNWGQLSDEIDLGDEVTLFGNTYSYTSELDQAIPAGVTSLRVISERGDVTVNASDQDQIKVTVRKSIGASNEADARQYDSQTRPQITVSGDTLLLNANTVGAGDKAIKSNLEITVPARLALDIATKRGDVAVRRRQGDVKAATTRGDIATEEITGNVTLSVRRGNVTASKITGDLSVDGRIDDTAVSDVSGSVRFSGDFFGDMNLSRIGKSVNFKSERTDLEFARLQGEMQMQSGDLHATGAVGPLRVTTRAKDIHLEDASGDMRIEDSNAEIEIHAGKAPLGTIQVENRRGRIALTVPENAGFQLDAHTTRGEIQSDFDVRIESSGRESRGAGSVGGGGPSVRLTTDRADIEIRKAG